MNNTNDPYQAIRAYHDNEIPDAIQRLVNDPEFISAIVNHRFRQRSRLVKMLVSPVIRFWLKRTWGKLRSVEQVQLEVERYLSRVLNETTDGVTIKGVEQLSKDTPYLFVSNHRDIAMDPALVNYALHQSGFPTARIAFGDNLLKKPSVTELMKLNKGFVVNRSAKAPRQLLKALTTLSGYIKHSLDEGHSIWIAQREGRAKDGLDMTDPAILKMFYMNGKSQQQSFSEYMQSLRIVPVSISYENDPCDIAKATELYHRAHLGGYQKAEMEDIASIIKGITGYKGRITVSFSAPINDVPDTPAELAALIDQHIHSHYQLYPINYLAAQTANKVIPEACKQTLKHKLAQLPEEARDYLIANYANPVKNALQR
ncbi:1-acyl-sn-glycerol-3-phosphate acyltransferase [Alteromonas sp. AMM-1]|uniref:1-acyl-sn-glycerol-3-phosphate acyltransferase n=1 Tax=Alteromonas sp. AMM-1 TaxID=3394233 RepID=UPI0039A6D9A3